MHEPPPWVSAVGALHLFRKDTLLSVYADSVGCACSAVLNIGWPRGGGQRAHDLDRRAGRPLHSAEPPVQGLETSILPRWKPGS